LKQIKGVKRLKKLIPKHEIDKLSKEDVTKLLQEMLDADGNKLKIDFNEYAAELESNLPLHMSLNLRKLKKD
jgi:hypothetical protein